MCVLVFRGLRAAALCSIVVRTSWAGRPLVKCLERVASFWWRVAPLCGTDVLNSRTCHTLVDFVVRVAPLLVVGCAFRGAEEDSEGRCESVAALSQVFLEVCQLDFRQYRVRKK